MRTIKFRGKRVDTQEWTFGSLVECHNGRMGIVSMTKYCEDNGIEALIDEVLPETVGQFTGLTDKNGKKIWEGDIVKVDFLSDPICEVRYHTGSMMVYQRYGLGYYIHEVHNDCIIIGNIHDTPALLKGGEE